MTSTPSTATPITVVSPAAHFSLDTRELLVRMSKYVFEGLAVTASMVVVLRVKPSWDEVFTVAVVAAATFSILDMLAPSIGTAARQGVGLGLGLNITNTAPVFQTPATGMAKPSFFAA